MKKRIYYNMLLLTLVTLLITTVVMCLIFYDRFSSEVSDDIREKANILRNLDYESVRPVVEDISPNDIRVTVVAPDGEVLFDNMVAVETMENHADRAEIQAALKNGFGTSHRFSGTLGEKTYYYAVRLPDGNILRTARTTSDVFSIFKRSLPYVILVAIFIALAGYFLATQLTRRIVDPISNVNLEGDLSLPYDEFSPFVHAIAAHREQIEGQMTELKERSDTIDAIIRDMGEGAVLIGEDGTVMSVNSAAVRVFGGHSDSVNSVGSAGVFGGYADSVSVDSAGSAGSVGSAGTAGSVGSVGSAGTAGSVGSAGTAGSIGRNVTELFRDVDLLSYTRAALAGQKGELNITRTGRDYHVIFSPVTGGGAMLFCIDVTEKTKAEKLRRDFSANVSHELKTPLTSINGYAEMLENGMARDEDRAAFIKKIRDEAAHLIALVDDVMMISKFDDESRTESFEDLDIAEVAKDSAGKLEFQAARADVSVNVEGTVEGRKVFVRGNSTMLGELFYNLIDNAIKYNKPGGSVSVRFESGESDGNGNGDGYKYTDCFIADTGQGIPEEAQSRVFERFYRVDESRNRKTGGTGLGLSIVKHIALLHGAEISLTSKEGEGTEVRVRFPTNNYSNIETQQN